MDKYKLYTVASLIGIALVFVFNQQRVVVSFLTFFFLLITAAITFTFINKSDSSFESKILTPLKYYQRKSSNNYENWSRAILLVVTVFFFINLPANIWWIVLIILWIVGIVTAVIPGIYYARLAEWNPLKESLYQEFKTKLTREDVQFIVTNLPISEISEESQVIFLQFDMNEEEAKEFINLYIKLSREL